MFAILKHCKQPVTQKSIELILDVPKIRTYILWQKDTPQIHVLVKQIAKTQYNRVDRQRIVAFESQAEEGYMDESTEGLVEEYKQVIKLETQNFQNGVNSNTIQKIFDVDAQQEKYNVNSKKLRDQVMLSFQFKKLGETFGEEKKED
jgi:hypothetical protein